ncbi:MAG: PspC domain-containing protein [Flavobacteriales bacterium]|nr:PspC domain-containing protein [Flavobacteriales bacterium]
MNKTVNANIAGLVFFIEEAAYEQLLNYLKSIEKNFSNAEERTEIMRDIESRIAEIFQERNGSSKEVVNMTDVEEVILIMGRPEDYQSEEYESSTDSTYQDYEEATSTKRHLYRDTDNSIFGGVCSGLGAYFGLDPVIVRVIFVLLAIFGFSGVFIYLILLFIMPEAKTTGDKLKMRGEAITVESIKAAAKDLKDNLKANADKHKVGKKITKTIEHGVRATSAVGRTLSKVIGFGMLVTGLFAMVILLSVVIGDGGLLPFWGERHSLNMSEAMDLFYNSSLQSSIAYVSILIILFIPIIGLIYSGLKLVLEIRVSLRYLILSFAVLWTLALGMITIVSVQAGLEFQEEAVITESIEFPESKVLLVDVSDDDIFSNSIAYSKHWENFDLIDVNDEGIFMGYPKLVIVESSKDSTFKVIMQMRSSGLNYKEAILNAEDLEYDFSANGDQLTLAPYMSLPSGGKFRGQDLEIVIRVPEGCTVKLGDNIERILVPITEKNSHSEVRKSFSNTSWMNDGNKMIYVD